MSLVSEFQVEEYHIVKLHADMTIIAKPVEVELQYYASYSSEYGSDGKWKGEIGIGFRHVPVDNEQAIVSEVALNGKFSMLGEDSDEGRETFEKRLRINGASTLIPIARAALTSVSAIMGYPNKITLPNLSVMAMKWKKVSAKEEMSE